MIESVEIALSLLGLLGSTIAYVVARFDQRNRRSLLDKDVAALERLHAIDVRAPSTSPGTNIEQARVNLETAVQKHAEEVARAATQSANYRTALGAGYVLGVALVLYGLTIAVSRLYSTQGGWLPEPTTAGDHSAIVTLLLAAVVLLIAVGGVALMVLVVAGVEVFRERNSTTPVAIRPAVWPFLGGLGLGGVGMLLVWRL